MVLLGARRSLCDPSAPCENSRMEAIRRTLAAAVPSSLSAQLWPDGEEADEVHQRRMHSGNAAGRNRQRRRLCALQDPEQGAAAPHELRSDLLSTHARCKGQDGTEDVVLAVESWSARDMHILGVVSLLGMAVCYAVLTACIVIKCES